MSTAQALPPPATRLLGLALACHPGPTAAVTTAATLYALVVGRSPAGTALVAAAVVTGQLTTGWQNDAIDAPVDEAVGRRDKPIPSGRIGRRTVADAAIVAGAATIVLSYGSGWRAGTVHTLAVALAASYNAGLKRTVWSVLPYIGAFGLLPCFVTLGAPGSPLPPWRVPVAVALLGVAAHVLNVLPDAELDRRAGVRSLPLSLPAPIAWLVSGCSLIGSSAIVAFGGGRLGLSGAVAFVGCTVVGAAALVMGARASVWGFRLACVAAIADVWLIATVST